MYAQKALISYDLPVYFDLCMCFMISASILVISHVFLVFRE